jgi:site-specific recombinase XerD
MIHIRGKGDKDRYTLLSDKASQLLQEYLVLVRKVPKTDAEPAMH